VIRHYTSSFRALSDEWWYDYVPVYTGRGGGQSGPMSERSLVGRPDGRNVRHPQRVTVQFS